MNWNDYEALWQRQKLPAGVSADVAELRRTFETKRRQFAKTLQVRDYVEAAAGVLVAGVFAEVWWRMGSDGWPIGVAIGLVLSVTGFFLRERVRVYRHRLGPEATVRAKLEAELAELNHQRRLLLSVPTWYLLPCAGAIACFSFALFRKVAHTLPPGFFEKLFDHPLLVASILGYFLVILPLVFWGIWALNRRAVRKGIEPRLAELEKMRQALVSSE
jgi:hypothetical protein